MALRAEATHDDLESSVGGLLDARPDFIDWVPASRTRYWCRHDPLLDWLDRYGTSAGFKSDKEIPGFDPTLDFQVFIEEQGRAFEHAVVDYLASRWPVTVIGTNPVHARTVAKAEATRQAMLDGKPLISQAVLWNEKKKTFGMVDLLARSDVLLAIFPATFAGEANSESPSHYGEGSRESPSPSGGGSGWGCHYRVVDIKFMTLQFRRSGGPARDHISSMVQCWIYNEALGELQGLTPPFSYLLGRGWQQVDQRGTSCFERLARVPQNDSALENYARQATDWVRLVRREGQTWQVLPKPTRDELYPNMKNATDFPWHQAKDTIARKLADLTMLWHVSPRRRLSAHAAGITRWDDPSLSAATLGFPDNIPGRTLNAILAANSHSPSPSGEGSRESPSTSGGQSCESPSPSGGGSGWGLVLPDRIRTNEGNWRQPALLEFYVDFETVNDLADDFKRIPEKGGAPRIFMIGCGRLDSDGTWQFAQFTVRDLSFDAEREVIDEWIGHLSGFGVPLPEIRLFHWSQAETEFLDQAYNSARARHPERHWPNLNWFDLLKRLARREPVTVTGALNFGLKSFGGALFALGRIDTAWPNSRLDGLAAMVAAWRAYESPTTDTTLIQEIGRYNEVDCRVMMEILRYLRQHH